jgi:hypothetical protein
VKPINLWVSDELYKELEKRAKEEGKFVNDYINYYLSKNFNEIYMKKVGDQYKIENFRKRGNMN